MVFSKDSIINILSRPVNFNFVNSEINNQINNNELFSTVFKYSPIGLIIIDEEARLYKVNNYFFKYLGMPYHEVTDKRFGNMFSCSIIDGSSLVCGESLSCRQCQIRNAINEVLLYGKTIESIDIPHKFTIKTQIETKWFIISASPITFNSKKYVLMSFVDITQRKRLEDQLTILGITDELTGLYNRRYLIERCKRMISECHNTNQVMSLVIIDLDNFKYINDTYGHSVGDDVLIAFAETLRDNLRSCDLAGRFGGEEFIIALPNAPLDIANKVIRRIQNHFEQLSLLRFNKPISFSGGLIQIPSDYREALSFEEALEKADSLLYWAKNKSKGTIKSELFENR